MKLILIRHGKTRGNLLHRYIGITDEPLAEFRLDRKYPDADVIITSPMLRCKQTAALIYPDRDFSVEEDLRETNFGDFENKSYEDLKNDQAYKKWLASEGKLPFPNGEAHEDFINRCISAYERIIRKYSGRDIAMIIHGGTIMAVMQHIFGGNFYDYQVKNLEGYIVMFNSGNSAATKSNLDYYNKF